MSVEKNINIVDVVAERIKNSNIGEFIKDEDLYEITKKAIDKALFQPRRVITNFGNTYHEKTGEEISLLAETARNVYETAITERLKKLINEDKEFEERIQKIIEQTLEKITVDRVVTGIFEQAMRPALHLFTMNLRDKLISGLRM